MIWRICCTVLIAVGSLVGAAQAAHWLLRDLHWAPLPAAQAATIVPAKTVVPTPPHVAPVGLGATQSVDGLTLTLNQEAIVTTSGFVAAPQGFSFFVFTVHIVNTTANRSIVYNAFDFVVDRGDQQFLHQTFAALADPLNAGRLPPHGEVRGTLAFLVPIGAATPRDLRVQYLPATHPDVVLAWALPPTP